MSFMLLLRQPPKTPSVSPACMLLGSKDALELILEHGVDVVSIVISTIVDEHCTLPHITKDQSLF